MSVILTRQLGMNVGAMRWAFAFALVALLWGISSFPAFAQSGPSDYTSVVRYDILGRTVGTIAPDPDGAGPLGYAAVRSTYDARGNVILQETGELASWQDAAVAPKDWTGFTVLSSVQTQYDLMSRQIRTTVRGSNNAITGITQYSYDALGRPECTAVRMRFNALPADACTLSAEGAEGPDRITKNIYDAADRLVQVRQAVGTPLEQAYATYEYTGNGQQRTVIDANGNRAELGYDGHDRLVRWSFPNKAAPPANYNDATPSSALSSAGAVSSNDYEAYTYDDNGNRLSLRKRDGRVISYQYDDLNRMTAKIVPDGNGLSADATRDVYYRYDLRGLQLSAAFDNVNGADAVETTYDGFGRLISSTNTMGGWNKTLTYTYDKNSNRTQLTHDDGNSFAYDYDGLNRNIRIREGAPGAGGTQLTYQTYTARGTMNYMLKGKDFNPGNRTIYTYDTVGRMTRVRHYLNKQSIGDGVTFTFGYNPAGQIKSRTISNDIYAETSLGLG